MAARSPELKPRTWVQKFWYFITHHIMRWRFYGVIPDDPKFVAVIAPHTSNWDFFILFMASRSVDLPFPNFAAKHTVFRGPIGAILKAVGGIPIDRTKSQNLVDQIVAAYNSRERMILGITPEGTRSKTEYWRSGFYYIAQGAEVPISLVFIDYRTKSAGMSQALWPSGDIEADMAIIRDYYADCYGRNPEKQGEVRVRPVTAAESAAEEVPVASDTEDAMMTQ